jgi:hypothetical protein
LVIIIPVADNSSFSGTSLTQPLFSQSQGKENAHLRTFYEDGIKQHIELLSYKKRSSLNQHPVRSSESSSRLNTLSKPISSSSSSNSSLSSNMKRKYNDVIGPEDVSVDTLNGTSFRAKKYFAASNQTTEKKPDLLLPFSQSTEANKIQTSKVGGLGTYDRYMAFSSSKSSSSSSSKSAIEKENTRNGSTASSNNSSNNSHLHCSICKDLANIPCTASCGHVCCQQCWVECLKRSKICPVCRAFVGKETISQIKIVTKSK